MTRRRPKDLKTGAKDKNLNLRWKVQLIKKKIVEAKDKLRERTTTHEPGPFKVYRRFPLGGKRQSG